MDPTAPSTAPKRVLVLDDDLTWREIAKAVLDKHGFAVTLAATLEEALAAFETGEIAVAIVDLVMPRTNGIQAIGALRKRSRNVAILGMSGSFGEYRAGGSAMRMAGADELLAKQAGPTALAAVVERLAGG
jgi:DNA-binding response OmpR family regulator